MSNLNQKYYPKPQLPLFTESEVIYIDRYNKSVTVSYEDKNSKEQSLELRKPARLPKKTRAERKGK